MVPKGTKGTFASCSSDARYLKDSGMPLSLLPIGTQFCIHADNGVIALVTITAKSDPNATSDFITVDLIAWQGEITPTEPPRGIGRTLAGIPGVRPIFGNTPSDIHLSATHW